MAQPPTYLIVGLDMPAGVDEVGFNDWYVSEHIPERLACRGFISATRLESVGGSPRYVTMYEITGPEALQSVEYLGLNDSASLLTKRFREQMSVFLRGTYLQTASIRMGVSVRSPES